MWRAKWNLGCICCTCLYFICTVIRFSYVMFTENLDYKCALCTTCCLQFRLEKLGFFRLESGNPWSFTALLLVFVRMESKDAAVRAIIATHGAQIEGYTVKCSWGKEMSSDSQSQQSSSSSSSAAQNQVPPPQSVRYFCCRWFLVLSRLSHVFTLSVNSFFCGFESCQHTMAEEHSAWQRTSCWRLCSRRTALWRYINFVLLLLLLLLLLLMVSLETTQFSPLQSFLPPIAFRADAVRSSFSGMLIFVLTFSFFRALPKISPDPQPKIWPGLWLWFGLLCLGIGLVLACNWPTEDSGLGGVGLDFSHNPHSVATCHRGVKPKVTLLCFVCLFSLWLLSREEH